MSKGPGRVMRQILEVLEDAGEPIEAPTLARIVGASEGSTRRALRSLAAAGRVACLGYARGGQRWGLPEDVAARRATWAEVWPPESQARAAAVMGERYARSVRRFLVAAL